MTDAGAGNAGAGNSGLGGSVGNGAAGGAGAGAGAGGNVTPWHNGIDPVVIGYAQNKGWIDDDPKVTFGKVIEGYRQAESKIGLVKNGKIEQLIYMPEPSAS